jgi:hypothetical protein
MSQHDDFLEGFGDALRVVDITDADEIEAHYKAWLKSTGLNDVERIKLEDGGYDVFAATMTCVYFMPRYALPLWVSVLIALGLAIEGLFESQT